MDNEILFSKLIIISVKESSQSLTKRNELSVEIDSHLTLHRKEVIIRISDRNDPFFLFITIITEDVYERIKSSQGLLIDFMSFPHKFIDLLNTCVDEQHKVDPKFMLTLTITKDRTPFATLDVIEVNPFKHLTHLSLKIPSANDSIIRSTLSNALRCLKNDNEKLQINLNDALMRINDNVSVKNNEIERIKREYELLLNETESRFTKDIEYERRKVQEINEKERKNEIIIEDLRRKLTNEEMNAQREQRMRGEMNDQINRELNTRITEIETHLRSKDIELKKAHETLVSELNERVKAVELCDEKQSIIDKHEETIEQLTNDLAKANEIIRKLQNEVQTAHSKLHVLNKVASKQDEVVGDKESRVKKLEYDLRQCAEHIKVKEKDYMSLRKELDVLRKKFDESQSQTKTNENVIAYLNKQLNDLQSKHGHKPIILGKSSSALPRVNLSNKESTKTDPKTIAQRNALFVSGGPRICDPFK